MKKILYFVFVLLLILYMVFFNNKNIEKLDNTVNNFKSFYDPNNFDLFDFYLSSDISKLNLRQYKNIMSKMKEVITKLFLNFNKSPIDRFFTIEKYLLMNNIPSNAVNEGTRIISNMLNYNNIVNVDVDYYVTKDTSVFNVLNNWNIDCLKKTLYQYNTDSGKINENVKNILKNLTQPIREVCSAIAFKNYCNKFDENYAKDISKDYMETYNIEKDAVYLSVDSFGAKYINNLRTLLTAFRENYGRELDLKSMDDLALLLPLIDEKIGQVNLLLLDPPVTTTEDQLKEDILGYNKIKNSINNYSIYNAIYKDIDSNVKNPVNKSDAVLCCSKIGSKECFMKDNNPIMLGYENMGYVKESGCVDKTNITEAAQTIKTNEMTVYDLLAENIPEWNIITESSRKQMLSTMLNIVSLYNYKGKNFETEQMINVRRAVIDFFKSVDINNVNNFVPTSKNTIFNSLKNFSPKIKDIETDIRIATDAGKLQVILTKNGFPKDAISLNKYINIEFTKNIVRTLIYSKKIFELLNINKSTNTILTLLAIKDTNMRFGDILNASNLNPKFSQTVLKMILDTLENNKVAKIGNYNLNSYPSVINYANLKPSDVDLDLCNNSLSILNKFRHNRLLSNDEYITFYDKIKMSCEPGKIKMNDINPVDIPLDSVIGLDVIKKTYSSYIDYVDELENIDDINVRNRIVTDNKLYNFIKNTYLQT